ncbi:MAG: restriction endonuclease [Deltaproteobacteria bacterium]|nr:restriction endonuclease [Deltaproteobacteria bacterium]
MGRRQLVELKGALLGADRGAEARGERPRFSLDITNEVSLTEWGLSSAMRAAEARLLRELAAYEELLRAHLADALRDLPLEAFEALLAHLLTQTGYRRVEPLGAGDARGVALMASHPERGDTLVLAQRGRRPVSAEKVRGVARSLGALFADQALVVSLSGFEAGAAASSPAVQLLDDRDLARWMRAKEAGVARYALSVPLLDESLLRRLSAP